MAMNPNALSVLCARHTALPDRQDALPEPSFSKSLPDQALDAFAELAVSDPKERFATAIRIDRHRRRAVLYLASNQDVPSDTLTHLKDLWRRLKSLSDAYALTSNTRGIALPLQLEMDIMRSVYDFSHAVVRKRFDKWWPVLKWVKRCNGKASEIPFTNPIHLTQELEFTSMSYHLGVCSQVLDDLAAQLPTPSGESNFTTFNYNMKAAAHSARTVLAARGFCERLARQSDSAGCTPPRLRQAIKKLVSLQSHLNSLFNLVRTSKKHLLVFSYDLTIEVIDPASTPAEYMDTWPSSALEWNDLEAAVHRTHSQSPNTSPVPLATPTATASTPLSTSCSDDDLTPTGRAYPLSPPTHLHPACAMIQHLESASASSKPTLRYVGLSHRPCRGCTEWIETYNALKFPPPASPRPVVSPLQPTRHATTSHRRSKSPPFSILPTSPYMTRTSSLKFSDDFAIPSLSAPHIAPILAEKWGRAICEAKEERTLGGHSGAPWAFGYGWERDSWVGALIEVAERNTEPVSGKVSPTGLVEGMGMEGVTVQVL